ncbi:MAG: HDIG domain-containing metalloprotein [Desulfovibrio sp.]
MLTRDEALSLLKENLKEPALVNHSLEAEAVMRALAEKLGEDADTWGLCGLLHDIDYSTTKDQPEKHGLMAMDILDGKMPEEVLFAIRAHNAEHTKVEPQSNLDYALRCGETVTGLIHTAALVRPTKMEGMKAKSLKKKMKDKAFAASVCRDNIRECDKIGLELGDFLTTSIQAITSISEEVGLK